MPKIVIITPQFERTDGITPSGIPSTTEEWAALPTLTSEALKALGCGIWDKEDSKEHWLFPKEWYDAIPEGYPITYIDGDTEPFQKGVTDDDIRFGMLAFGFIRTI